MRLDSNFNHVTQHDTQIDDYQEEIIDEEFSVIQIQWAIANCTVEENFSYVKSTPF